MMRERIETTSEIVPRRKRRGRLDPASAKSTNIIIGITRLTDKVVISEDVRRHPLLVTEMKY